jgi:hypothetical protein
MKNTIKENGYKIKFYKYPFQHSDNSLCGWYAIYIAKKLNKHKPKNIFKYVYDLFGDSADNGDIKKLIEGFGLKTRNKMDVVMDE